ncbi:hypothetical protein RB195_017184 [Necator americanus]|uniref:Uncharacterized protein n=1 Tax=Necator americanus TaxID=51031 RepID=A0ABR1C678_NECAM
MKTFTRKLMWYTGGRHMEDINILHEPKIATETRFCFFGHMLGSPADVQRVPSLSDSSWKRPLGQKLKSWTEVIKEDLRTLGMDRQFRRYVWFRRMLNSDEWIDSVQEHQESWAELCSRTAHLAEDAGNRFKQ